MHLKAGFNVKVHTEPFPDDEIRGQLQLDDKSVSNTTQQFFLTKRSLFVLVWDIRHGWEAGKLYNWLDRIQAIAPESPVMIVATHILWPERQLGLVLSLSER